MTTIQCNYPSHVPLWFQNQGGEIVLDQLRAIDKSRLAKRVGLVSPAAQRKILQCLSEMFS